MRFDYSVSNVNSFKKKYKILLLFSIILILVILIYNIIINNFSNNEIKIISKNSRRIINNLDNYTETMSEFIVNNNNYNSISNNDILNSINEIQLELKGFKEKELEFQKEQLEVQKELKGFKEKELEFQKEQLEVQKELKGFKEKELELQKEQLEVQKELKVFKEKELNIQIRKNAIEFLEKNYGIIPRDYNLDFFINNNNCIKQLLNLDIDLFSLLLNIDYENLTVSFNYFNENKDYYNYNKNKLLANYYENIINNPIYKILKNKLKINYSYNFEELNMYPNIMYNQIQYYNKLNIIEENNKYFNYIENITNKYPYNQICNINSYNYTLYLFKLVYNYYSFCLNDYMTGQCYYRMFDCYYCSYDNLANYIRIYISNIYSNLAYNNIVLYQIINLFQFNYIKIYNEYEYIKQLINLEGIPIISPIKF